jgi:hypothetical protein
MFQKITTLMLILLSMIALISQAAVPLITTAAPQAFTLEENGKTAIPLGLTISGYVKIELTWQGGSLVTTIMDKNGKVQATGVKRAASPVTFVQEIKDSDFKNGPFSLELSGATKKITGKVTITRSNVALPIQGVAKLTPAQISAISSVQNNAVKAKLDELNRARIAAKAQISTTLATQQLSLKNRRAANQTMRLADIRRLDNAQPVPTLGDKPILTDLNPEVLAGTTITLTGKNFKNGDRVAFKKDTTVLGSVPAHIISTTSMTVVVPTYAYDAYVLGSVNIERPIIGGTDNSNSKPIWYLPNVPAIQSFTPNIGVSGDEIVLDVTGIPNTTTGNVIFEDDRGSFSMTVSGVNWSPESGVKVRIPTVSLNAAEGLRPFAGTKQISVKVQCDNKTSRVRKLDITPEFEKDKELEIRLIIKDWDDLKISKPANKAQSKISYDATFGFDGHPASYYSLDKYGLLSDNTGLDTTLLVTHTGISTQGFRADDELFVSDYISPHWIITSVVINVTHTAPNASNSDINNAQAGNAEIIDSPVNKVQKTYTKVHWWNQPVMMDAVMRRPEVTYSLTYIGKGPKLTDYSR